MPVSSREHSVAEEQTLPHVRSYRMSRYLWRASLGIVGPCALLGLFTFISVYFLDRQPQNEILTRSTCDATTAFYIWFVAAVFTLEWARTALANFQATALMIPTLAPTNAMTLFWHADDNWANPLWWLRALRNTIVKLLSNRVRILRKQKWQHLPGLLWVLLSMNSILIFIAVPLSGLTMEIVTISIPGTKKATIRGPTPSTFGRRSSNALPSIIDGSWRSGVNATPPDASYFFAPEQTRNVSLTYFEDMAILNPDDGITTFLGPSVDELVAGVAFGMKTTLNCKQVAIGDLKLVQVRGWSAYSIKSAYDNDATPTGNFSKGANSNYVFLNETRGSSIVDGPGTVGSPYSFIAAADGSWNGDTPFASVDNVDGALLGGQPRDEAADSVPTALLELFLWQAESEAQDPRMKLLQNDPSSLLTRATVAYDPTYSISNDTAVIGMSIQCHIRATVGYATINPQTRAYHDFSITNTTGMGGDMDVYGPQILSVMSLGDYDPRTYSMRQIDTGGFESRWVSLHQGIGDPASRICMQGCNSSDPFVRSENLVHLALTPANLTYTLYRLLGQSIIASMGAGSQDPWQGDLVLLEDTRGLKPGPVSYKPVLVLLTLWTVITVGMSLWTMFHRRWAPALSGFELFRFGAPYEEEIQERLTGRGFEDCGGALNGLPGMVGVLPGGELDGTKGFLGLSESPADSRGEFVWKRSDAGKFRAT
jgi:hypothetical protein